MSLIYRNLFDRVLVDPIKDGADTLFIVSGYATATMATRHIEYSRRVLKKEISINLIIGMCPQDGIQRSQHLGFQKLESREFNVSFKCNYVIVSPQVHSKIYAWYKEGEPFIGYIGSANYTQNAFSPSQREVVAGLSAAEGYEYFQSMIGETVSCLSEDVPDLINIYDSEERSHIITLSGNLLNNLGMGDGVSLPLIVESTGEVHQRSGLNWGQRPGREPNQAYIPIPSAIGKADFFPDRYNQFMVLTDDNKELICVRAQENGKAIHTTLNNSLMGEYFRYRLGLPNGAFVTKDDLLRYGRCDVDFYKIDNETYYMNFSVGQ